MIEALLVDFERGIRPEQILVVTFTRSAAANMQSRLVAGLIRSGQLPHLAHATAIGTIDAIAQRVYRSSALEKSAPINIELIAGSPLRDLQLSAFDQVLRQLDAQGWQQISSLLGHPDNWLTTLKYLLGLDWQPLIGTSDRGELAREITEWLLDPANSFPETKRRHAEFFVAALAAEQPPPERLGWARSGNLLKTRADLAARIEQIQPSLADSWLAPGITRLLELRDAYAENFLEQKQFDRGGFEYADLLELASEIAEASAPIYTRAYLDEAQDTSAEQLRLVEALTAGPIISIGDANQSIYRFRGADVENYRQATSDQKLIKLRDNYRSLPAIVDFVNRYCAGLPGLEDLIQMRARRADTEVEPGRVELLSYSSADLLAPADSPGQVPDLESSPAEAESSPGRAASNLVSGELEAGLLAEEIKRVAARRSWAEITVLVHSNKNVSDLGAGLRRAGIPVVEIRRQGLLSQPEVIDLIAYLELVHDRNNSAALLRVLSSAAERRSPAALEDFFRRGGAKSELWSEIDPEFAARFERVSSYASQSLSLMLRFALEYHQADLALGLIDPFRVCANNQRRFIELVEDLEQNQHDNDIEAILKSLRLDREHGDSAGSELDDFAPGIDAVKIMTIHQAKGDEFPVCYLTGLSRSVHGRGASLSGFVADRQRREFACKKTFPVRGAPASVQVQSSYYQELYDREQAASAAESWRLFYVAATRAADELYLVVDKSKLMKNSFFSLLSELNGAEPDIPTRQLTELSPSEPRRLSRPLSARPELLSLINPDQRNPRSSALSYTKLSDWRRCSLRRHLELDLGVKAEDFSETGIQVGTGLGAGSGRTDFGIRFHRMLELGQLEQFPVEQLFERESEREQAATLVGILRADEFIAGLTERRFEETFTARLGDWLINGKIDMLGSDQQGVEQIIDWKTGSEKSIFNEDYLLQRRLYAYARLLTGAEAVGVWSYEFPEMSGEIYYQAGLAELEQELLGEVEALLSSEPTPASQTEAAFCRDCPGRQLLCPVAATIDGSLETLWSGRGEIPDRADSRSRQQLSSSRL